MDQIPIEQFRAQESPRTEGGRIGKAPFFRGPVNLEWLQKAAELPGQSPLLLALALHHQASLQKSKKDIRMTRRLLGVFNIKRRTAFDALTHLHNAGLVKTVRLPGRCVEVSLLACGQENSGGTRGKN